MLSEEQLKGSINTPDRQLLWDIRTLLRESNEIQRAILEGCKPTDAKVKDVTPEDIKPHDIRPTKVICKKCGKGFDNRGKFFQHMKAHKKEGK